MGLGWGEVVVETAGLGTLELWGVDEGEVDVVKVLLLLLLLVLVDELEDELDEEEKLLVVANTPIVVRAAFPPTNSTVFSLC